MGRLLSARKGANLMAQPRVPSFNVGWRHLYEAAMLEVDDGRLPTRIADARRAMHDRVEEVLTNPSSDEHRVLGDALRALRILEEVATREKTQH
jgi:hypothetical protein